MQNALDNFAKTPSKPLSTLSGKPEGVRSQPQSEKAQKNFHTVYAEYKSSVPDKGVNQHAHGVQETNHTEPRLSHHKDAPHGRFYTGEDFSDGLKDQNQSNLLTDNPDSEIKEVITEESLIFMQVKGDIEDSIDPLTHSDTIQQSPDTLALLNQETSVVSSEKSAITAQASIDIVANERSVQKEDVPHIEGKKSSGEVIIPAPLLEPAKNGASKASLFDPQTQSQLSNTVDTQDLKIKLDQDPVLDDRITMKESRQLDNAAATFSLSGMNGTALVGNAGRSLSDGIAATVTASTLQLSLPQSSTVTQGATAPLTQAFIDQQTPQVISQVATAIVKIDGDQKVTLRLDPPELGKVDIDMKFTERGITVVVSAERSESVDLMRRNATELLRELRQAGLTLSASDMTFSQQQQNQNNKEASSANVLSSLSENAALHAENNAIQTTYTIHSSTNVSGDDRLDLRL